MGKGKNIPDVPLVKGKKPESKYDPAVLRNLVKEGKTAKQIMDAMGIGHKQILKHHLMKLCATDKTFYEVPGLYERNNRKAFVNAQGEIRIKQRLVDFGNMVLTPETEFDVVVEGNKIILINLSMEDPSITSGMGEAEGEAEEQA